MSDTHYDENFVAWFRAVTPYVNAFRGKTFVIAFGGKAVSSEFARTMAYDVNLLASLGIAEVAVHRRLRVGLLSSGNELGNRARRCIPDRSTMPTATACVLRCAAGAWKWTTAACWRMS